MDLLTNYNIRREHRLFLFSLTNPVDKLKQRKEMCRKRKIYLCVYIYVNAAKRHLFVR